MITSIESLPFCVRENCEITFTPKSNSDVTSVFFQVRKSEEEWRVIYKITLMKNAKKKVYREVKLKQGGRCLVGFFQQPFEKSGLSLNLGWDNISERDPLANQNLMVLSVSKEGLSVKSDYLNP
ncbi:hypothetical protein [Criblamydia sequanensis]|uniref:Uncharacterized protein n=1 Tax=Candidatus Criblamydia sequanensis CRIB-18 TaxID=1437425 RepID=A0A090CZ58_9BACT|nr:hypothetical protein [Criblamydia sequanensis]CDR34026.1 hypothetical protein CSEC_1203 [Criblamydia sequanensis CRIB-18]